MSRERELLQRALDELEILEYRARLGNGELIADIRAELQKPEPVECGVLQIQDSLWFNRSGCYLPDGKYVMVVQRIEDE